MAYHCPSLAVYQSLMDWGAARSGAYYGQTVVPYMVLFSDIADIQIAQQLGASEEDAQGNFQSLYTSCRDSLRPC